MGQKMNPYQRIIKDGEVIQEGQMDTPAKFAQLVQGIDFAGKHVLDIGCNLGMMCQLARDVGASYVKGIDIDRDYIKGAREVFPTIEFECTEDIAGDFDIIICSAMLHYVKDLDKFFSQLARCGKVILLDVWLDDSQVPCFTLTHRDIFIPSRAAFYHIAGKYFNKIEEKGEALSPDESKRYIFHLSEPKPSKPQAILIYGDGNTGKTTLAMTYFGYKYLGTDHIFRTWKYDHWNLIPSVAWFGKVIRGEFYQEYIAHYINHMKVWLKEAKNRDIVLEGYDLLNEDLRQEILNLLGDWQIKEIRLEDGYNSPATV